LPLKNKTNQFFLPFICCRLGRSRIEKKNEKKERKVRENIKKNPRKKNKKK
jgi:hypothetical protein